MKISQFLPKGVGVLFPEKTYLKINTPPLPVKKSNPVSQVLHIHDPSAFTNREYSLLFTREAWKNLNIWGVLSNASGTGTVSAISHDQHWCVLSRKPHPYFTPRHSWPPSRYSKSMQFAGSGVSLAVHTISRTRPPKWYNQLQGVVLRVPRVHNLSTKDHFLR